MPRNSTRFGVAFVLLLAGGVYANTLSYGAAWDDTRFVFQSGATEGIGAAGDLLTSPYLRDVPAARSPYRPLTAISYALDWTLGGGQAAFFHWTNVTLHVGVTALLMAILAGLAVPTWGILAAGVWFAVHPVHVEAVANLAGRAELLAAFFACLSVWLFLRAGQRCGEDLPVGAEGAESPVRPWAYLAGSVVAFALALGAKENAVVVLPILTCVAVCAPIDGGLRAELRRWPFWLGIVLVGAGYMLIRRAVLGTFTTYDVAPFIEVLPTSMRVSTAVANWWEYARLLVLPKDLVVDYGPAVILPSAPLSFAAVRGVLVLFGALGAAWWAWRRTRLLALGGLWFGFAIFPTSNLLVPIAQWIAERFLYLPSVGAAIALGAAVPLVASSARTRRTMGVLGVAAAALLAGRTWTRNQTWQDTETVAATLLREHPEAFRSQWLMGSARLAAGDTEGGLAALARATELNPGAMELHLERSYWLIRLQRPSEAEAVLRLLPERMHPDREAHLVRSLLAQGRVVEAEEAWTRGRQAFPTNAGLTALGDSLAAVMGAGPGEGIDP